MERDAGTNDRIARNQEVLQEYGVPAQTLVVSFMGGWWGWGQGQLRRHGRAAPQLPATVAALSRHQPGMRLLRQRCCWRSPCVSRRRPPSLPLRFLQSPERRIYPTFFSDHASDFTPDLSERVTAALKEVSPHLWGTNGSVLRASQRAAVCLLC